MEGWEMLCLYDHAQGTKENYYFKYKYISLSDFLAFGLAYKYSPHTITSSKK